MGKPTKSARDQIIISPTVCCFSLCAGKSSSQQLSSRQAVLIVILHSVCNLLGRPIHQLVNANISSANHVAAAKCIKASRRGQEVQLFFRPNFWILKKSDLSVFDCGMIVIARQCGLSISETADLLGFSCTRVSRVCRECLKKQPVSSGSAGKKTQKHIVNERGQRRKDSNTNNHALQQWYAEEHQTSKWLQPQKTNKSKT